MQSSTLLTCPATRKAERLRWLLCVPLLTSSVLAGAQTMSMNGQSGLINMPDARTVEDGTFTVGWSYARPLSPAWVNISVIPHTEIWGLYTRTIGYNDPNFGNTYGSYKDKSIGGKVQFWPESTYFPALAVTAHDFLGNGVYESETGVASKRLGPLDLTAGYGRKRIKGFFGGLRYNPQWLPGAGVVVERDKTDFKGDPGAFVTGSALRKPSTNMALEYQLYGVSVQLGKQHGVTSAKVSYSVSLDEREYNSKVDEPAPFTKVVPRPTEEEWKKDVKHVQALFDTLAADEFTDIHIRYSHGKLALSVGNVRISDMSRAVGRAARIALALSPLETREISVTYTDSTLPIVTYDFFDAAQLQRYFNGQIPRKALVGHVVIKYAAPGDVRSLVPAEEVLKSFDNTLEQPLNYSFSADRRMTFGAADAKLNYASASPYFSTFLNDPSGAFHYEIGLVAAAQRNFGHGLFFVGEASYTLKSDFAKITQKSNSLLPHVRSDVAQYGNATKSRIDTAVFNQFMQPAERIYARASAGIYEDMYVGFGGQVLYLPRGNQWSADLAVDALKQRDFYGRFGLRDYTTLTAIASVSEKLPFGLVGTVRAGRFLARDIGARFEMKRVFKSGFEVGGWYTFTNGHDITSPGSPTAPYHDKGIFVIMPLAPLLTKDTRQKPAFVLSPWSRDVGQMVQSPADLAYMLNNSMPAAHVNDGMTYLGESDND